MAFEIITPAAITDANITTNVVEDDYDEWDVGDTYAAKDRVRVVDTDVHLVFESGADSNSGNDPLTDDGTNWIRVGATNAWRMFDGVVQAQTTNPDSIEIVHVAEAIVDGLAAFTLDAASAHVTVTAAAVVVYDETFDLISDDGIDDYDAYFFAEVVRRSKLSITDLPPYYGATIAVDLLSASGEDVGCGELVFGKVSSLGDTAWGPQLGMVDYSERTTNAFGDISITARAYSPTVEFLILVRPTRVDWLFETLTALRATALVWLGNPTYRSTIAYGYFESFNIDIAGPTQSRGTLSIKGLT